MVFPSTLRLRSCPDEDGDSSVSLAVMSDTG